LLGGCLPTSQAECTPCEYSENIDLFDLLLNEESIPQGWYLGDKIKGIATHRSWDSAQIRYMTDDLYSGNSIWLVQANYRFECVNYAESDYADEILLYRDIVDYGVWKFVSPYADESSVMCDIHNGDLYYCNWVARYDCIVVSLIGDIHPDAIPDMEYIAKEIDTHVASILGIVHE